MDLTNRSLLAVGVALVGTGIITVTPAATPPPRNAVLTVELTSDFDPLGVWQEVLNTASTNATAIAQAYSEAPLPVLQQSIVNHNNFFADFLNNPADSGTILREMWDNLKAAHAAKFDPFVPAVDSNLSGSLDSAHQSLSSLIAIADPSLAPLLDKLSSPISGVHFGDLGVLLSPLLQTRDDVTDVFGALFGPDANWATAFQDLVNMPANLTGAFLNGYGEIDLLPWLERFGIDLPTLPIGSISALDLDLGGLLSPGGSGFNAVGVTVTQIVLGRPVVVLNVDGNPAGPLASLVQLEQAMAQAIGWDTVGNPLTHLVFPTVDWGDSVQALTAADDLLGGLPAL